MPNSAATNEGPTNPILNQQWEEPPHMQAPMMPTHLVTPQQSLNGGAQVHVQSGIMSRQAEVLPVRHVLAQPNVPMIGSFGDTREHASIPATNRGVENRMEKQPGRPASQVEDTSSSARTSKSIPVTNRQIEQNNITQCTCHIHPANVNSNQGRQATANQRMNVHTEYQDPGVSGSQFFQNSTQQQECKVIHILPDNDVHYIDLVRDSVAAQAQKATKPMFVNNYFMGDNWNNNTGEKHVRHIDESKSRASTAVQMAVSFLGKEEETNNVVQTGLSRVKAMANNKERGKTQSPLVVEPMKNGNSTGWSTNSFNLPEMHQITPMRQQCEGLPDVSMPPPPTQPQAQPQLPTVSSGMNEAAQSSIVKVIEKMTETMDQQMRLSATRADYNMQQNTKMMDQFIRAQDRRDLDPALMDIPTFTGEEPEKCLEWIT